MSCLKSFKNFKKKILRKWRLAVASTWRRWHWFTYRAKELSVLYSGWAMVILLLVLYFVGFFFWDDMDRLLRGYFSTDARLSNLRTLYVSLGGALVGASAIAFSFVMFAMQVNVERLPHGLFRAFNRDFRILSAFVGTIILSISVACFSLVPLPSWVTVSVYNSLWALVGVFILFMFAYRRALILINPTKQLGILTQLAKRDFDIVVRHSVRAQPFFESDDDNQQEETFDVKRLAYFQNHPGWTESGMVACNYAMAFVHRYAEMGDYDVAASALGALICINSDYIKARGKTYLSPSLLMENPTAHDGFINNTLEHLRQSLRGAIARGDERHIELIFKTLRSLIFVYAAIEYSRDDGEKTHANLAASYLASGVKDVGPHGMVDVLMEGTRQMGEAATVLIHRRDPRHASVLARELVVVGSTGAAKKEFLPVTEIVMEQFRELLIFMLRNCDGDTSLAFKDLTQCISFVAKLYLKLSDDAPTTFTGRHLSPVYAAANSTSFLSWFVTACAAAGDNTAEKVFLNVNAFASSQLREQREVFLAAVEKDSSFFIDMVMWIDSISHALFFMSGLSACPDSIRDELRKHAYSLLCIFTWIPDERDAFFHVGNSRITEKLFLAAKNTEKWGFHEYSEKIRKVLLRWTFKGGKYATGWEILERGLCALCILGKDGGAYSQRNLLREVAGAVDNIPQELRDRAARRLKEEIQCLGGRGHIYDAIGAALASGGDDILESLMNKVAILLSPDNADELVHHPSIIFGDDV